MPASYLYYGSRALGNGRARRNMNIAYGNRYRYIIHHKKHGRPYQVRVQRFLRAQTEAHPTFGRRIRDDSHNAKTKVSFNRYCKMPVSQRRKVDVRGWDTRFGHMYQWELGKKIYNRHRRLTRKLPKQAVGSHTYKARYINSAGKSRFYK